MSLSFFFIHRIIACIHVPVGRVAATHWVLLGPATQRGVVVAGTEVVQVSAAVVEAAGELPGVGLSFLLRLDLAIRIVVIGIVLTTSTTIRQADDRVQVIEQVIVRLAIRRAFTVQQAAAAADVGGFATGVGLATQTESTLRLPAINRRGF